MAKQEDIYFVIRTDDKGQAKISKKSKTGLEKMIAGLVEDGDIEGDFLGEGTSFKGDVIDLAYCENKYIIIKGEVIVPKPVTTVTKYGIE